MMRATPTRQLAGQAMIESVIVMMVICLLFFGLFQLAHAFASREILRHAAGRAARARSVGFNGWMVTKVMRVATIPNAGRLTEPQIDFSDPALQRAIATLGPGALWDWSLTATPSSARAHFERARVPDYLASENHARADYILDYERWDEIHGAGLGGGGMAGAVSQVNKVNVRQQYPLSIMVRMLFDWVGALTPSVDDGSLNLRGEYAIESHYPLYLDDAGR